MIYKIVHVYSILFKESHGKLSLSDNPHIQDTPYLNVNVCVWTPHTGQPTWYA